jgi:hypothetical protein
MKSMKSTYKILFLAVAFVTMLSTSCKDKGPDLQGENARKLARAWKIGTTGNVRFDQLDVTANFLEFEIQFTSTGNAGTYAVSGGKDVFDASGSWSFVQGTVDKIILTGSKAAAGKEILLVFPGNRLVMDFTVPAGSAFIPMGGDAVESLPGRYRIELDPK